MLPHEPPTSSTPLERAARALIAAADAGTPAAIDSAMDMLRCVVLRLDLATVTRERDMLHQECERLAAAVNRQRADIEQLHEQARLARRAAETRQHVDGLLSTNGYASEREAAHG